MSPRRRVLVVDDSVDVHRLVAARLRAEDIDVLSASGADEGLALARREAPDLVLLDVDMPGRDGFSVCRELKDDRSTYEIAVIFLTGEGDVQTKVRGFDLGAVDYITKPFHPAELRARVRSALRVRELQELLAARAMIDGLTGLYNRAYFDRRLAEEAARSGRHGTPLALVMVDVDRFKSVNDHFGHPGGDRVLREVSTLLRATARVTDIACRYGGEEFALIAPGSTAAEAAVLAERLRTAVPTTLLPDRRPVTASFGVAALGGGTAEELVSAADGALYRAKCNGRDRVEVATAPPPT